MIITGSNGLKEYGQSVYHHYTQITKVELHYKRPAAACHKPVVCIHSSVICRRFG
jgi:hypothetical protein